MTYLMKRAKRANANVSVGMQKNSTRFNGGYFKWLRVTGWEARSPFSDSIVGDGLALKGGVKYNIQSAQARAGSGSGNEFRIVTSEGVQIGYIKTSAVPMVIPAFDYTPTVDTIIYQEMYTNSGLGGRTDVLGGPDTFITATLA